MHRAWGGSFHAYLQFTCTRTRFDVKVFSFDPLIFQANSTFKFPDLFPKVEPKDDKPTKTDTVPEEPRPFHWF